MKRPSFQFYPKDWLSDQNVIAMTAEERGAYWHIISIMWTTDDCSLDYDEEYLGRLSGVDQRVVGRVVKCFYIKDNKLRHKRLDNERIKQDEWREKSIQGGKKSAEVRSRKIKGGSRVVQPKVNTTTTTATPSPSSNTITKVIEQAHNPKKDFSQKNKCDPAIDQILSALKNIIGIDDFADAQKWQRIYGKHCLNLSRKIGKEEFRRRLTLILEDGFKHKRCNEIRYLYNQIKGFIEPISPIAS